MAHYIVDCDIDAEEEGSDDEPYCHCLLEDEEQDDAWAQTIKLLQVTIQADLWASRPLAAALALIVLIDSFVLQFCVLIDYIGLTVQLSLKVKLLALLLT